jgi:hypothetical protein
MNWSGERFAKSAIHELASHEYGVAIAILSVVGWLRMNGVAAKRMAQHDTRRLRPRMTCQATIWTLIGAD